MWLPTYENELKKQARVRRIALTSYFPSSCFMKTLQAQLYPKKGPQLPCHNSRSCHMEQSSHTLTSVSINTASPTSVWLYFLTMFITTYIFPILRQWSTHLQTSLPVVQTLCNRFCSLEHHALILQINKFHSNPGTKCLMSGARMAVGFLSEQVQSMKSTLHVDWVTFTKWLLAATTSGCAH